MVSRWATGLNREASVLNISVDRSLQCTVCRPVGELDAFTVSRFRQTLADLVVASGIVVVLDLGGVAFIDSAGLGALIGAIRRVRELGGEVAVACPRRALARLLQSTGFDRIVPVCSSVEEAANLLAPASEPSEAGRARVAR
jgi:anti-sigma B factor antagonist